MTSKGAPAKKGTLQQRCMVCALGLCAMVEVKTIARTVTISAAATKRQAPPSATILSLTSCS